MNQRTLTATEGKCYPVGHVQAYRIICKAGLNNQITEHRKKRGTKRFHGEHCNIAWQTRGKKVVEYCWISLAVFIVVL